MVSLPAPLSRLALNSRWEEPQAQVQLPHGPCFHHPEGELECSDSTCTLSGDGSCQSSVYKSWMSWTLLAWMPW